MRTESKLFIWIGTFMMTPAIAYLITGHYMTGVEIAGTILMFVVAIAFLFIGTYLAIQARRMGGLRPEDWDATPADGAGDVGSFPVSSIYPFMGASSLTLVGFGLVFNVFLCIPGIFMILLTVIGMARESEISDYGHLHLGSDATEGHAAAPTFSDNVKK